ncbi:cation transporting ATPase C-terminal domain-containing protein, partial [Pseudomonas canadensis]|uniref:cation transporting ATPase C-terminal domain-containing protein n=2 Tax=Pseudomonadota TaxID=1224 RepID=UPI0030D91103
MLATVFLLEVRGGMPEVEVRALVFFALIAEILALILVNRSFGASIIEAFARHNSALRAVLAAIVVIASLIFFLPAAQILLKFGSIAWIDMVFAVGLGAGLLVLLELCKPVVRSIMRRGAIARPATA